MLLLPTLLSLKIIWLLPINQFFPLQLPLRTVVHPATGIGINIPIEVAATEIEKNHTFSLKPSVLQSGPVPAADIDSSVAITTIEIESGGTALNLHPPHLKVHPPTSIPHVDKHECVHSSLDVPGAILNSDHLEQYSVDDLKRWLACRGILVPGNKADLISRIKAHVEMGKSHKIDPIIDRGHWHEKKRAKFVTEMKINGVCGRPLPPNKDWQPFPGNNIPKGFSERAVDRYLEDDCPTFKFSHDCGVRFEDSDDPDDDFDVQQEPVQYQVKGNVRRGTKYLKNNYDGVHYYIKAQVQASMQDGIHVVSFNKALGETVDCSCECKARALKRCSHFVAVLLLLFEHIDTKGHDEEKLSSTHMLVDCITEFLHSHLHSIPIIMTPIVKKIGVVRELSKDVKYSVTSSDDSDDSDTTIKQKKSQKVDRKPDSDDSETIMKQKK
ncbi:Myocardin-related transcription factor B [Frankliniella fusca]|uniref:Myocardin-related transcription factor B n=1 Tax=Frankliniella fusca TaxID=407009 RepID=A0AAE1H0Y1_9NEOP|nr:Myocardin-related transcription factor B [Frankliniella fusca]